MSFKQICVVVVFLIIGHQHDSYGRDGSVPSDIAAPAKAEPNEQLEVNRNALFSGTSEQIRIKAATVMLFSEDPAAREVLLDALKQSENKAARMAVCQTLSQNRVTKKPIKDKYEFVQPLLGVLTTDDQAGAQLAAEATLIFEYEQISEQLEKIATDSSLPARGRLNAIYALKLQLDKRAIFKLMDLLDDPDKQISAGAEEALQSLAIPIGKDAEARKQIRDKLKRKGITEFLRDLLSQKEDRIRELVKERDLWRSQYLSALDKIYNLTIGETAKGQFLAERLGSSETIVKLWVLEKARQSRLGTEKSKFPAELGPILVSLVSDQDREVRLQTAKLLSLLGDLNSAEKLLQQIKVEQDDEVRMELFIALGGACYYAFLPDSQIKIPLEMRKQTLEEATRYLVEPDWKKAQKGAEVIKKLLDRNGLAPADVDKYLGSLAERYKQEKDNVDGTLRGELLSAMAALCVQSVYNAQAKGRFEPLFEEALSDKTDLVREAAVDGLINIDKTKALKIFRKGSINDNSIKIREKLIELAGQAGDNEDLDWLWEKMGSSSDNGPAWVAMLRIFGVAEADVLDKWMGRFNSEEAKAKLSDEQAASYLKVAERKIDGEKKPEVLKDIRKRLASFYRNSGKYEEAADYLGRLCEAAKAADEKKPILAELLDVYLRWPKIEAAAKLMDGCLLEGDLEPNSLIVTSIDNYVGNPPAGADSNAVLKSFLVKIKAAEGRPNWAEQVKRWTERLGQAKRAEEPKPDKPENIRK